MISWWVAGKSCAVSAEGPLDLRANVHRYQAPWSDGSGAALAPQRRMKRALQMVLAVSLFGVAFSGVLSYREVFSRSAVSCPTPGAPGTVFGYPACVYGFFMYLIIVMTVAAGLLLSRRSTARPNSGGNQ